MLVGGLAIVMWRFDSLRSENRFDSLLSRESAFLANNVLFLVAAFTVMWGTIYPIVAEAITGTRLTVGPPFFNAVFIPIGLALLVLTGLGPLISWRRMRSRSLARISRGPAIAAFVVAIGLLAAGVRSAGALIAFAFCAFTTLAIGGEFVRGSRVHRRSEELGWISALGRTLSRNRRRYGGYIVHLGVVLIVIGLAGGAFKTERQAHLQRGESLEIGDYELVYDSLERGQNAEKQIFDATIAVTRDGREITTLHPQRNLHIAQQQWQSEVAIRSTPIEDLYVVVTAVDPDGDASVRAFVNPLTWWIWTGAVVMALGMGIILWGLSPVAVTARARTKMREQVATAR